MVDVPYFFRFLWTIENERHIAKHGITPGEFEEVVLNAQRNAVEKSRTSDRLTVAGYTSAGRLIECVYEEIDESCCYPVTAYDM